MQNEHVGPLLGERNGLRVIDCKACGYAHLETLPSADDLDQFYTSSFWQVEKAGALDRIAQQREWWVAVHGDWLELCGRYTNGRDLLDVGSGYGFFMDTSKSLGWNPWGIEPSREACEYADRVLGWQTFNRTWQDWDYSLSFHLVSALWLIEHLPDPLRFLEWAHDRLVIGGVLLSVVPNDFSPAQLRANHAVDRPFWWIDKTHLNYFTPESFANLIGRAGFRIVERSTLYPVERFLIDGMDYTNNPVLGAKLYDSVTHNDLEMTRTLRLTHYQAMSRRGEGRELVVVAVRE